MGIVNFATSEDHLMAMTFMRTGTLDSEEARKQYRDDPEAVRQKDIVASAERIGGKVVLARAKAQHRRELGAAQLQELDPRWLDFLTETTTIDGYAKRHELESEAYEELDLVSTLGLFDGYEFRHTPDDNQTAFLLAYQLANIGGVTEKYYFEIARDGEDATNIIDRLRAVRRARLRKKLLVGSGITSAIAAVACLAVLAVTAVNWNAVGEKLGGGDDAKVVQVDKPAQPAEKPIEKAPAKPAPQSRDVEPGAHRSPSASPLEKVTREVDLLILVAVAVVSMVFIMPAMRDGDYARVFAVMAVGAVMIMITRPGAIADLGMTVQRMIAGP